MRTFQESRHVCYFRHTRRSLAGIYLTFVIGAVALQHSESCPIENVGLDKEGFPYRTEESPAKSLQMTHYSSLEGIFPAACGVNYSRERVQSLGKYVKQQGDAYKKLYANHQVALF